MKANKRSMSTQTMVMGAILTALVVILQFLGAFIRFGPFSISLVLIPIVIGAATCGTAVSTWLGFVFGLVVLISGDAAVFLAVDVFGTVLTVIVKGTAAGLLAGLTFRGVEALLNRCSKKRIAVMKAKYGLGECCEHGVYEFISRNNKYLAVLAAAIVCPVVNTGIVLLGCVVFFMDTVSSWAAAANPGGSVIHYMFFILIGANFLVELVTDFVLSPIVVRIVHAKK